MQKKNCKTQLSGLLIAFIFLLLLVNVRVQARNNNVQELLEEPSTKVFIPLVANNYSVNGSLWASSAHSDTASDAFTNWDNEEPPEIPVLCAKCHSTPGYLDYLGMDGTPAWVVDNPAPVGTTVECDACHNDAAAAMTSVEFHSGAVLTGLGGDANCMQCHQGHGSTPSVDAHIGSAVGSELDTVSGALSFQDIHNQFVGDLLYGTWVQGGYEYNSQNYDAHFDHVAVADNCLECHEPHSLQIRLESCQPCHSGVNTAPDIKNIRRSGSLVDYDGDGNTTETIEAEIAGLQEMLYLALRTYTGETLAYTPDVSPYFIHDPNNNGIVDEGENTEYASWTGRLVRAAYNYHLSIKAPGAYVHGAKYIIELLYDSIADLNTVITPVDLSSAHREDAAHFNASDPAWRNWDSTGSVPSDCARCHSTSGYSKHIQGLTVGEEPVSAGLNCEGCHDDHITFSRFSVPSVEFANGAFLSLGSSDVNLCMGCHQSRLSTTDVDDEISGMELDTVDGDLSTSTPITSASASTLFGDQAEGMYQYAGESYLERYVHQSQTQTCLDCHNTHKLEVSISECEKCHKGISSFQDIRDTGTDYDGNGNIQEGMAYEIESIHQALYNSLQTYAENTAGTPFVYDAGSYPFFYIDTNGNGDPDPDEITPGNAYASWTPGLFRAAYNYLYLAQEPGAYVHHFKYVIQVLYDSIEDIGGDVSSMTRP